MLQRHTNRALFLTLMLFALAGFAPGAVLEAPPLRSLHCEGGVLRDPDGGEAALWGVNYQPSLSWEYGSVLRRAGVPLEIGALRRIIDTDLPRLRALGVNLIRVHLLPGDFTDAEGGLRDTVFLDALDYLVQACARNRIYCYLTLVNEMGKPYLKDSYIGAYERKEFIFSERCAAQTRRYLRELLTRTNRYTGRALKDEPALAVIEIMNEPAYPDYQELKAGARFGPLRERYAQWRAGAQKDDVAAAFAEFRGQLVQEYIDRTHADLRAAGARQPVVWNLNWPGFIKGHEDVFAAAAASKAEAVSFCLYPGQGDVQNPFWAHPADLNGKNYLPFLADQLKRRQNLGWLLEERFRGKARLVYEFETMYNQSAYLYPAMARLFRALGAQAAAMWRYNPAVAAQFTGGSHTLNDQATPAKAMSFQIAGEAFRSLPRGAAFDAAAAGRMAFGDFALSFGDNLSLLSRSGRLLHSGSLKWSPLPVDPGASQIVGCGDSPLAQYGGSGIYRIQASEREIEITIQPDVKWLHPAWQPAPRGGRGTATPTCLLDERTTHTMTLKLKGWDAKAAVWRMEPDGAPSPVALAGGGLSFPARAGRYKVLLPPTRP